MSKPDEQQSGEDVTLTRQGRAFQVGQGKEFYTQLGATEALAGARFKLEALKGNPTVNPEELRATEIQVKRLELELQMAELMGVKGV